MKAGNQDISDNGNVIELGNTGGKAVHIAHNGVQQHFIVFPGVGLHHSGQALYSVKIA